MTVCLLRSEPSVIFFLLTQGAFPLATRQRDSAHEELSWADVVFLDVVYHDTLPRGTNPMATGPVAGEHAPISPIYLQGNTI